MAPVGFRFMPTHEELIHYFLQKKENGQPLPHDAVKELDPFEKEPWQIFDENSQYPSYVFTKLKKKNKQWTNRTIGSGTWVFHTCEEIRDSKHQIIGYDREFLFSVTEEQSTPSHGNWVMHQFSLSNALIVVDDEMEEYVICEVRNKDMDPNSDSDYDF